MKVRLNALARVIADDQITLDLLLKSQLNAIIKISLSTWINAMDQMEKPIQTLKEKITWLSKLDSDNSGICSTGWVRDLRSMVEVIILLGILFLEAFLQCHTRPSELIYF